MLNLIRSLQTNRKLKCEGYIPITLQNVDFIHEHFVYLTICFTLYQDIALQFKIQNPKFRIQNSLYIDFINNFICMVKQRPCYFIYYFPI